MCTTEIDGGPTASSVLSMPSEAIANQEIKIKKLTIVVLQKQLHLDAPLKQFDFIIIVISILCYLLLLFIIIILFGVYYYCFYFDFVLFILFCIYYLCLLLNGPDHSAESPESLGRPEEGSQPLGGIPREPGPARGGALTARRNPPRAWAARGGVLTARRNPPRAWAGQRRGPDRSAESPESLGQPEEWS